jgi:hypothetical protein
MANTPPPPGEEEEAGQVLSGNKRMKALLHEDPERTGAYLCNLGSCVNHKLSELGRAVKHLTAKHMNVKGVPEAVTAYKQRAPRTDRSNAMGGAGLKKAKLEEERAKNESYWGSVMTTKGPGTLESLFTAIASFIVMCNMAISIVSNPFFLTVINAAIEYGRKGGSPFTMPSRDTFRNKWLKGGLFADEQQRINDLHSQSAMEFGLVLSTDGRKNVKGDALEVACFESISGFVIYTSDYPDKGEIKNNIWHAKFYTSCIQPDNTLALGAFSHYFFAISSDGASAVLAAVRKVANMFSLLPVLCQLHASSRTLLHLYQRVPALKECLDQAKTLVHTFRSVHWAETLLAEASGGLAVHRIVDTRMLSITIVMSRLLRLRPYFIEAVAKAKFQENLSRPGEQKATKDKIRNAMEIIKNDRFWQLVEFGVEALGFITVFGREMDKGKLNACLVNPGWLKMIDTIKRAAHAHPGVLSVEDFALMVDSVRRDFKKYNRPVFEAAHLLCPWQFNFISKLKSSDRPYFLQLQRTTLAVLMTVAARFDHQGDGRALFPPREVPESVAETLESSLSAYLSKLGDWRRINYDKDMPPRCWWDLYAPCPVLSFYAKRVLAVTVGGSNTERAHKGYASHHEGRRHSLNTNFVDSLVRTMMSISADMTMPNRDVTKAEMDVFLADLDMTAEMEDAMMKESEESVRKERESLRALDASEAIKKGVELDFEDDLPAGGADQEEDDDVIELCDEDSENEEHDDVIEYKSSSEEDDVDDEGSGDECQAVNKDVRRSQRISRVPSTLQDFDLS